MDVLWSYVDFHISNENKCRYIVGQHNGDLLLFLNKLEINVARYTKNVDPPHLRILTMWIHHISTFPQCGVSTPTQFNLYPLLNQSYFLSISQVDSNMVQSLLQLSMRWPYDIQLVGKMIFASLEANLDWGL